MQTMTQAVRWDISLPSDEMLEPMFYLFGERHALTRREVEVMRLLVLWGMRNEDLAAALYISVKTVKHHLASLMQKTRTRSSRELQSLFLRFLIAGTDPVALQ